MATADLGRAAQARPITPWRNPLLGVRLLTLAAVWAVWELLAHSGLFYKDVVPSSLAVMEAVLRSQTQAYYGPQNAGHFGLALSSYAHFTSPIRRYADLLVHRSLVSAYGLGPGGLTDTEAAEMERLGEQISMLERRAMEAERDTVDRYVAAYLSERVGEVVEARITGVLNFGFFATVEGIGGDGLMPARDLGREYFRYDEAAQTLVGEETGTTYASGQRLRLRLAEANPGSRAAPCRDRCRSRP